MADVTVNTLAKTVGTPVDKLLQQLADAGINKTGGDDAITADEKIKLLESLRKSHGKSGKLGVDGGKKVTLKRKSVSTLKVGGGAAGRSKTVNVEVRKKRTYVKKTAAPEADAPEVNEAQLAEEAVQAAQAAAATTPVEDIRSDATEEVVTPDVEEVVEAAPESELTPEELAAEVARKAEEEARALAQKAEEEARAQVVRMSQEAEQMARQQANQALKAQTEEQGRQKAQEEAKKKAAEAPSGPKRKKVAPAPSTRKTKKQRAEEHGDRQLHVAPGKSGRRGKKKGRKGQSAPVVETRHAFEKPTAPVIHDVELSETITVGELAQKMAVKAMEVIKVLMDMGVMATINQNLDQDTATLVVEEMGHNVKLVSDTEKEDAILQRKVEGKAKPRPAVVTIMGHVDHGKTSLLDYIRETRVTAGEAGGITQHIGAYHVETDRGTLTFLDTPGHAAFTAMRARGAQVTDIVVLVVAADDGVMPQTEEAIQHARAAGVPLVIAINKMDKESADPDRVKTELSKHEVLPEDWGGDTQFVPVSAHTGQGVDDLLDALALQAELLELSAVAQGQAKGVIIESRLDKGRGPVATVLVQEGTLNKGDIVLSGKEFGRVRAMVDETGKTVENAGPSIPVEILGLSGAPNAGDDIQVVSSERQAREVAMSREAKYRETKLAAQQAAKLESMFDRMKDGDVKTINIMIKADVQGSVEALRESLLKLATDDIRVNVIAGSVGGISESDVNLALASEAVVIAFNVRADATARRLIQDAEMNVRYYSVIYDVINDVRDAMTGMLGSEIREEFIGLAEVRDVFRSSKLGAIAGCMITEGVVKRSNPIRVLRDNVVVYEGELESLRRFKDDVAEVRNGTECGIGVKGYNDVQPGDQIECFEHTEVARTL